MLLKQGWQGMCLALSIVTVAGTIGLGQPRESTKTEEYRVLPLSVHDMFRDLETIQSLNGDFTKRLNLIISELEASGVTPIGASFTWVFPSFVNAAKVPETEVSFWGSAREARADCIPSLDSKEYLELVKIRNSIHKSLAREFSGLETWMVGFEPNYEFYDCSGRKLGFSDLIHFFVDALEGISKAVKSEIPDSVLIANFVGVESIPIIVDKKLIQPPQVLDAILEEITLRGNNQKDYFDRLAVELAPVLLEDRYPEEPTLASPGEATRTTTGWNVKWLEEFETTTADLVANYDEWDDIDSPECQLEDVAVNSDEEAELRLDTVTEQGKTCSFAGAMTDSGEDVVPDAEFDSSASEKNKWTAVADFFPVESEPSSNPIHTGGFLRVNDRNWDSGDEQTRFGATAYSEDMSSCGNDPCGGLQFTGDDKNENNDGKTTVVYFDLDELPWNSSTHLYRAQILERERNIALLGWTLEWRAEVWDLTDNDCIGYSSYIHEYTVEGTYDIDVPELSNSKLAFGLCCEEDGGVDTERSGTSYWVY